MKLNRMLVSMLAVGLVAGVAQAGESKRADGSHDSRMESGKSSVRSDKDTGLDNAEDRGSDRGQERKDDGMDHAQSHEHPAKTDSRHRTSKDSSNRH